MTIEQQFATVADELVGRDATVEPGRMLHAPGLRAGGRFFAFATRSDLVVKPPAKRVEQLIGSGAGRPCEIRRGAPLREWVRLSPTNARAFASYVVEARDFASQQGR